MAFNITTKKELIKHVGKIDVSFITDSVGDGEFFADDKKITPSTKIYKIKVNRKNTGKFKSALLGHKVGDVPTPLKWKGVSVDVMTPFGVTIRLMESGKTSGASDGATTAMQELASLRIIEEGLRNGKRYKTVKEMASKPIIKELTHIYPGINDTWMKGLVAQHVMMNKQFGGDKFDTFNRDGGFMDWISQHIKAKYGIAKKDSWNPADIWLIKGEKKVRDEISATNSITQLNDVMKKQYKERRLVGISLKAVSGATARFEKVNLKEDFIDADDYELDNIRIKLSLNSTNHLTSTDTVIVVKSGHHGAKFQLRQNSKGYNNLKFEPTKVGAGAARLGKVPLDMLKLLLINYNIKDFDNKWQMYPANGQEFEEVIDEYTMMYTKIHNLVYSQVNKVDDAIQNIKESFGTTDATNGYTTSKLMQIKFLYHLCLLSDTKRDNLLTEMLYLAQKKGPQFGPFGKLY
jgi:hypothetical protein